MSKILCAFRLSPDVIELLKKLCEKHDRSQANMLEVLIKEAAKKELPSQDNSPKNKRGTSKNAGK